MSSFTAEELIVEEVSTSSLISHADNPDCTPYCNPDCSPDCRPNCSPNCDPNCNPNCNPRCSPNCSPCFPYGKCNPDLGYCD